MGSKVTILRKKRRETQVLESPPMMSLCRAQGPWGKDGVPAGKRRAQNKEESRRGLVILGFKEHRL